MFLWAQQDSERFGPQCRDEHHSSTTLQLSIQPGAQRVTLKHTQTPLQPLYSNITIHYWDYSGLQRG